MPGCDPVQPDLVVVRRADLGIIADRRIRGIPSLLIEVLSPSNAETDTEIKRKIYARAGVLEYWIARPSERDILVYTEPDAALGDYIHVDRITATGRLVAATVPVQITVASLFEGAPDLTV
jgi:Uma2 family endonuclease